MVSASSGEYTTRTSPPWLLTWNRSFSLPGTRSMSPNEQKITSGRDAISKRLVDDLQRRHADRASGPVDHLDGVRQQLVDAVPDDRMRLAATHFHDRPALAGRALDLVDELAGKLGIAELVQILHDNTSELPFVFGAAPAATFGLGNASGFSIPACFAASSNPSPNSSLSTPRCSNSARVRFADSSSRTLKGETHVHNHVFADLGVRNVLQADVFLDAAEVDDGHQRAVTLLDAQDSPRYRQTHGRPPFPRLNFPRAVAPVRCRRRWAARADA